MNDPGEVIFPYGKYKGTRIAEIPDTYLRFVCTKFDERTALQKKIVKACSDELEWREKNNQHID